MLNLNLKIPEEYYQSEGSRHCSRRMKRLPPVLRDREQNKHDYDPKMVSFGPYHHGKPDLFLCKDFKHEALELFVFGSGKDKKFFYNKILEEIDEIRGSYVGVSKDKYDDEALTEMMLLDGCFLINHMEMMSNSEKFLNVLYVIGMLGFSFTVRDMCLVENQIPFRVIRLLISLRYDREKGEKVINKFLNFFSFQDRGENYEIIGEHEESPLHLLDAVRRTLVSGSCPEPIKQYSCIPMFLRWFKKSEDSEVNFSLPKNKEEMDPTAFVYTCRSVTDLKAKGINFKPSRTVCLKDIKFKSCSIFYGELHLPIRFISKNTKVLFSNLIAYEVCPNNVTDYTVLSYMNLMKSLIHGTNDVKELREQKILISSLSSDEEVMKVFKDINTCGLENAGIFHDVKEKIEQHYNSKTKTWMAELIHTYFESPWTVIALFAATFILVLSFTQTYYTIYPTH